MTVRTARFLAAAATVVVLLAVVGSGSLSCRRTPESLRASDSTRDPVAELRSPPTWAGDAIWYQIFVERFRNGDPSNDPRPVDTHGAWPHLDPPGWRVTPWGRDWYRRDDWEIATGAGFYKTVQARRYGGDLRGVIDRLDYLVDLGVNAIYLNPINDSPSLHKYDARSWRHVDRNFGPDPQGDAKLIASEDPVDPATWRWTSADRLFLRLLEEAHARGLRVIVDYSFNHTGITFWAWRDVAERQRESRFAGWYEVQRFDDPATPADEFSYEGWMGVRELPEMRKLNTSRAKVGAPLEGDLHPGVKRHVFAVVRRWLDPDGDGDPSDGVDGFRLDVAERVPLGFWRDFRRHVRTINPQAFLVAELWWRRWPDDLLDPAPWLRGDVFDASMSYRWYVPVRSFIANAPPARDAKRLAGDLRALLVGSTPQSARAMMNVAASHDTPRLVTSLANPGKYKYRVNPRLNPGYRTRGPDGTARLRRRLLLVQQFTWIGAPHIWYGDEVGMWGADDPDCRKPMVWDDIDHDDEVVGPRGEILQPDPVQVDDNLRELYRRLIRLRRDHADLFRDGDLEIRDDENDDPDVFVYRRSSGSRQAIVVINRAPVAKSLPPRLVAGGDPIDLLEGRREDAGRRGGERAAPGVVPPLDARVLVFAR